MVGINQVTRLQAILDPALDVFSRSPIQVDFDTWKQASEDMAGYFRGKDQGPLTRRSEELLQGLRMYAETLRQYGRVIESFNALPAPSGSRDPRIGENLYNVVINLLRHHASHPIQEELLLNLHERAHKEKLQYPTWMRAPLLTLAFEAIADALPDERETYIRHSAQGLPLLEKVEALIAEKEGKLSEMAANAGVYRDAIELVQKDIEGLRKHTIEIFDKVSDLTPEKIPEVLNGLNITVSASPEIVKAAIEFATRLEQFLMISMLNPSDGRSLQVPAMMFNGQIIKDEYAFSFEDMKDLANDPPMLAMIMEVLVETRTFLRSIIPTMDAFPRLLEVQGDAVAALKPPFLRYSSTAEQSLDALMSKTSPQVREALCILLGDPFANSKNDLTGGHTLEIMPNIKPLLWAAKGFLASPIPEQSCPFYKLLRDNPQIEEHLLPLLQSTKDLKLAGNFQKAAQLFHKSIRSAQLAEEPFAILAPVIAIGALLSAHPDARERLRSQIPSLDVLKDLADSIASTSESLGPSTHDLVGVCRKSLSYSLSDYYRDSDLDDLWQLIDDFKLYLDNRTCLEGIAGNEGMRSGVIIAGAPGVGKTFFVECLEKELGVKMFKISSFEDLEEAKKYAESSQPCMIFFDEADKIMRDRDDPRTTPEQASDTDRMLEEIDEIRKKYPWALILAATNYPDKIDAGMTRQGRFDVHVLMGLPSELLRKHIILETLSQENIPWRPDEEQMATLLEVTSGMPPLPIKREIHQLNRLGALKVGQSGKSFEFTHEQLASCYQKEARRLKKSPFLKTRDAEDTSQILH